MSIMKQDLNFNLIFLIGIAVFATVLLTLYYSHSLGNVNVDYNDLEDQLSSTQNNLSTTMNWLQTCEAEQVKIFTDLNETKVLEEKSREEYNEIYEQTEGELTKTQTVLKDTKDDLTKTLDELQSTTNELNAKSAALSAAENEIDVLKKKVTKAENKLDDIESCVDNNNLDCVANVID